jgi:hypothetical protein
MKRSFASTSASKLMINALIPHCLLLLQDFMLCFKDRNSPCNRGALSDTGSYKGWRAARNAKWNSHCRISLFDAWHSQLPGPRSTRNVGTPNSGQARGGKGALTAQ